MIGFVLVWWLASSLLGLAAFPIAYRFLNRLPDRGFAFARALGILLAGYALWLGASIGVLRNNLGGALMAVLILMALGAAAGQARWREIGRWLRDSLQTVLGIEIIFLACFAGWAFVRANNPDITYTEKPMELAFLNAILRSETFPPADPWLSGYAISYYHFGYVLLAFLARLTGVSAGYAFNLGNALWFALTAVGLYSLVYNLLSSREGKPRRWAALLGPAFVLFSGNLEGVLEVLHARHLFWRTLPDGSMTSGFWTWLGLPNLAAPPVAPPSWIPTRFWMWWQASRVVVDVDLNGLEVGAGPIDEFPLFSFLLADNHPHLLALPFVLLAIAWTLQIYLGGRRGEQRLLRRAPSRETIDRIAAGAGALALVLLGAKVVALARDGVSLGEALLPLGKTLAVEAAAILLVGSLFLVATGFWPSFLSSAEFMATAWLFGALAFLNTWDLPIYLTVLLAVGWWCSRAAPPAEVFKRVVATGVAVGAAAVILYVPWYPTFSSQASGILPNLPFPTRLSHFLIMFGTMFIPLFVWLVWRIAAGWRRSDWWWVARLGVGLPAGLLLLSWILAAIIIAVRPATSQVALDSFGVPDARLAAGLILLRRFETSWTALLMGVSVAAAALMLRRRAAADPETARPHDSNVPYIAVLAGTGALLVLGPEFLYLKDLFDMRMNTVFKFYFAAWLLWGVAAAYVSTELWPRQWDWRGTLRATALIPLVLGFFYSATATLNKTDNFSPPAGRTLDGVAHQARDNPEDFAAILWLHDHVRSGVLAEAVGGSYTEYARISAHTGLPTVLGWPWHEVQWRGSNLLLGSREEDIRRLYQTRDGTEAQEIVEQYNIDFVYVGPLERSTYTPVIEAKFTNFMDAIYQLGEVTIFATRDAEWSP